MGIGEPVFVRLRETTPWQAADGDGHPQPEGLLSSMEMTQMDAEGEKGSKVQGPKSKAFSPKPAVKLPDQEGGAEMAFAGNTKRERPTGRRSGRPVGRCLRNDCPLL